MLHRTLTISTIYFVTKEHDNFNFENKIKHRTVDGCLSQKQHKLQISADRLGDSSNIIIGGWVIVGSGDAGIPC